MRQSLLAILFTALSIALPCCGQVGGALHGDKPVATVAGQSIYEKDLTPLIQGEMTQLRNQEFEIKSHALDSLIQQKLLEAEAKKRGITTAALLDAEVDSKVKGPTEAEVQAVYLNQKDRINRPFEAVKKQIEDGMRNARLQEARQDYLQKLESASAVTILLQPPRTEVTYDAARSRGSDKAGVTIVEFSDFQCPFCRRAEPTVQAVQKKYGDRVKLAYRDFPLREIHPFAQSAAEASRCAQEQGKFWEYHDALLADASRVNPSAFTEQARSLGLDAAKFDSCLSSGKYRPQIEKDVQDGMSAGVSGTPAFFINGVFLSGAQPESEFDRIIDRELAAQGQKTP